MCERERDKGERTSLTLSMSAWPSCAVTCTTVCPLLFESSRTLLFESSSEVMVFRKRLYMSRCPSQTAAKSGELESESFAFGSASL